MSKIGFITWDMTVLGGVNQVTVTLANEFSKEHEVHVISLVKGTGQAKPVLQEGVHDVFFVQEQECRGREVIKNGSKILKNYLKEHQVDVVFLMGFQVALPAILMMGGVKCKKVFCEHEALMSRWHERKITLVRYLAAVMSDKIVTLTEQNAIDYRRQFHFKTSKVDYIYNSIDEKILQKRNEQYDATSKIILSVGRVSAEKGYDMLVDVAKDVFGKHPDWKWYIYGAGDEFDEIAKKISDNQLEDKLVLQGETKDVASVYKQGALFVLTSKREGLPLVLLEAKANHLPCISFDIVSGPKEIIRHQVDGVLIPPYEKKMMAEAICNLIEDEELRCKMARNCEEDIERFSIAQIMNKWNELLESL